MCASLIPGIAAYLRACRVPRRPAPITAARRSGMGVYRQVSRARGSEEPNPLTPFPVKEGGTEKIFFCFPTTTHFMHGRICPGFLHGLYLGCGRARGLVR